MAQGCTNEAPDRVCSIEAFAPGQESLWVLVRFSRAPGICADSTS